MLAASTPVCYGSRERHSCSRSHIRVHVRVDIHSCSHLVARLWLSYVYFSLQELVKVMNLLLQEY